jgi:glucan phosphoethanolaminetransferase (alkaline phosphatase superfamily)
MNNTKAVKHWLFFFFLWHSTTGLLFFIKPPIGCRFHFFITLFALLASFLFLTLPYLLIAFSKNKVTKHIILSLFVFCAVALIFTSFGSYFLLGTFVDPTEMKFFFQNPWIIVNLSKAYFDLKYSALFLLSFICLYALLFPVTHVSFSLSKTTPKNPQTLSQSRRAFLTLLAAPILSALIFKRIGRLDFKSKLYHGRPLLLPPEASFFAAIKEASSEENRIFMRSKNALKYSNPKEMLSFLPQTIVLVINESWGRQSVGLYGSPYGDQTDCMPYLSEFIKQNPNHTLVFPKHFSNSNNTTLSMLSLLTGVRPCDPLNIFAQMPCFFSYFQQLGFRTVYLSTQSYSMPPISKTYFQNGLDVFLTGEDFGASMINDTGIDEGICLARVQEEIRKTEKNKPLLLVYNTNALHAPFETKAHLPEKLTSIDSLKPHQIATRIVDEAIHTVFTTLKSTGRLDDSLIWLTADHGETDVFNHGRPRMQNFHNEIMHIPSVLYYPNSFLTHPELNKKYKSICKVIKEKSTQNLDIIPTLLDLYGFDATASAENSQIEKNFAGVSLFHSTLPSRPIVAANANLDGVPQSVQGCGIFLEDETLLISSGYGIELYNTKKDPLQQQNLWPHASQEHKKQWIELIKLYPQIEDVYRKAKI